MTARLADRVALVTGAGSGIGLAAANLFAAEGAAVAVVDVRAEAADEAAGKIVAEGGRAVGLVANVADAAQVAAAVTRAAEEFGRIDVLYNNAGVNSAGSVADAAEDDWDRCFDVNVKGTYLFSRAVVPHLRAAGGGAIVNQGSVAGLVGVPNFAAYCAAKGAVVALTRSMAIDLAPDWDPGQRHLPGHGVHPADGADAARPRRRRPRRPGLAKTVVKYPIGRLGNPEEIARVALFLASDDASFITGSIVTADGGMTAQ